MVEEILVPDCARLALPEKKLNRFLDSLTNDSFGLTDLGCAATGAGFGDGGAGARYVCSMTSHSSLLSPTLRSGKVEEEGDDDDGTLSLQMANSGQLDEMGSSRASPQKSINASSSWMICTMVDLTASFLPVACSVFAVERGESRLLRPRVGEVADPLVRLLDFRDGGCDLSTSLSSSVEARGDKGVDVSRNPDVENCAQSAVNAEGGDNGKASVAGLVCPERLDLNAILSLSPSETDRLLEIADCGGFPLELYILNVGDDGSVSLDSRGIRDKNRIVSFAKTRLSPGEDPAGLEDSSK